MAVIVVIAIRLFFKDFLYTANSQGGTGTKVRVYLPCQGTILFGSQGVRWVCNITILGVVGSNFSY